MENWEILLAAVGFIGAGGLGFYFFRKRKPSPASAKDVHVEPVTQPAPSGVSEVETTTAKPVAPTSLATKLEKTRGPLLGRMSRLFSGRSTSDLLESDWEEIEEALLEGDVGVRTVSTLLEKVKERIKSANGSDLRSLILEESEQLLSTLEHGIAKTDFPKPWVISIVGVNGVGKTTTLGKLAQHFSDQGKSVLLGAGDTFRAAAISQLKIWAERTNSDFVTGREGADPGAVAFDSVQAAKSRGTDVVLLDTAGRLHTKKNLMDELVKIQRVVKKVIPEAPHETWLVIDGTLGQNSIVQAQQFKEVLSLTGVVVTKLDGTAKGGAVFSIVSELNLPIKFIGVGEGAEDLLPFKPKNFVEAILGKSADTP